MESKAGSFAWIELATTDPAGAKNFYTNLFGWKAEDMPMGPDMTYTMFRNNGKDVGGAYKLMKEQIDAHVPPHWMLYIQADSADASAAKAISLGAQQIMPPSDIPNVGRFAVITDPTGAHVSIFQPGSHKGMATFQEDNALCWADLNTPDAEKASKFYSDWLGWTYEIGKDGYRHILNGKTKEDMIGGIPPQMHAPPGTPAHWMAYFAVKDARATGAKATQLGANTLMPAELMPDVGTIAVLADPQGAVFAIYQHIAR
jgi:predicted enzyme related to lactoylglutathione lyase